MRSCIIVSGRKMWENQPIFMVATANLGKQCTEGHDMQMGSIGFKKYHERGIHPGKLRLYPWG